MTTTLSGVSVLICSYNGASRITETLQYLAKQEVPANILWEIILVDNASTDNLQATAAAAWETLKSVISFRIIYEATPGKENAVDKGIALSRYSYVIICDDDNWLAEDYVAKAYYLMSGNPLIGMAGGRGLPVFETSPPSWFSDYQNYYAVGEQNKTTGEVATSKGFLWGAGAVINKAAYHALLAAGYQRVITYKRYPKLARSEDIELCLAIKLAGYKLWYDDQLQYHHYISSDKLQWKYLIRLTKEGGMAGPLIRPYQELIRNASYPVKRKKYWLNFMYKYQAWGS
jgi:glycosyltransferase involved in cell wall biosynthesis